MTKNFEFETPISNFRRIIDQDFSDKFLLRFKLTNRDKKKEDFVEIETTRNEARIISKKINDILKIDPTIDEYDIQISDEININKKTIDKTSLFNIVTKLIKSTRKSVEISREEKQMYNIIQFFLGENEIQGEHSFNENDIENEDEAISLLNTELNDICMKYLSKRLKFIIESGKTKTLNEEIIIELIDMYFSQETMSTDETTTQKDEHEKEEEYFKIFSDMNNQGETVRVIMHFIIEAMKSSEIIRSEMIEYFYDNLDDETIENEQSRIIFILRRHISIINENHKKENAKNGSDLKGRINECEYSGDELKGIISYLKTRKGDDIAKQGILKLTGGGYPHPSCPITNFIKYDQNNINEFYYNFNGQKPSSESDSWIEFDFVDRKINLTSYTIRSCQNGSNSYFKAKSWRIVGSNDHNEWEILDHKTNRSELNNRYSQHRFECSKSDKYYRYIRYIQEDSWDPSYCKYAVQLTCFELFGSILEPITHK